MVRRETIPGTAMHIGQAPWPDVFIHLTGGGVDTFSQRRLYSLKVALSRLDALVAEQNAEIAGIREAAAADPRPSYVQHTVHDTAHRLGPIDGSRTSTHGA